MSSTCARCIAGLVAPINYALSDTIELEVVPEVDAATNQDGGGRHFAASAVAGLSYKISKAVSATFEVQGQRDNDPAGHATAWLGAVSLAWQPAGDLQFDIQANAGLNRDAPDLELIAGIARRF